MCLPQIIDYKIVSGNTAANIETEVRKLIEDGYEPFGSLFFPKDGWGQTFALQPMVLYSRPEAKSEPPLITEILRDLTKPG